MRNIFWLVILFITPLMAQEKTITCGFGQCSSDFVPTVQLDQLDSTFMEINQNNEDDILVNLPENANPRNLFLVLQNNSTQGKNLVVDFTSKKEEEDAPNFTLIGDVVNNLSLELDGYDGANGEDASVICARRFRNGDYGESSRNFFLNRRDTNNSLSLDRCDEIDVAHIQETKFSCQNQGYNLEPLGRVSVERIKVKQRCIGTTIRNRCLQKTMSMTCEWAARSPGYKISATKHSAGKRCRNPWASSTDCGYNYSYSCWHSRTTYQTPPANVEPKWTVLKEIGRCRPRFYGGKFALQFTDLLPERRYLNAVANNNTASLCASFPSPRTPYWFYNRIRDITISEPGLDPETLEPLPGSTWDVKLSGFFQPCDDLYDTLNSVIDSWTAFGEVGNECGDASIPEDPNNVIPWNKAGLEQRTEFGTESILCTSDSCLADTVVRDLDLTFDTIDPTIGANGTKQGRGTLLVYDIGNLDTSSEPGSPGLGGNNDLPILEEEKLCVKIDDANTRGLQSSFAKDPIVNFNIYQWQGLDVNRGEPGGSNPEISDSQVKVYKKIDSSVRHLLKQETF